MRVIFLEDVPGTADAGEVKEVKNGFARNFLLPRGLAAPATKDALQRSNAIEKSAQAERVKHSSDWQTVADAISGAQVVVEARVGPTGRLFGAVTGRHIAERLSELTERTLDHRQILLGEAIHDPGDYDVNVRLYREVLATVKVSVIPEGYTLEEAAELAERRAAEQAVVEEAAAAAAATAEQAAPEAGEDATSALDQAFAQVEAQAAAEPEAETAASEPTKEEEPE